MISIHDALSILQTIRNHTPLVLQLLVFGIMAMALASPVPGHHQ